MSALTILTSGNSSLTQHSSGVSTAENHGDPFTDCCSQENAQLLFGLNFSTFQFVDVRGQRPQLVLWL